MGAPPSTRGLGLGFYFFYPLQNTAAVADSLKGLKSGSSSAFGKSCPKCGLKADALGHVLAVFIPECSSIPGECHGHTVG